MLVEMIYSLDELGIYRSSERVAHKGDEYDETGFEFLADMQRDHFWYRGRHRFLLRSLGAEMPAGRPSAIDLGGGTGGWVHYLSDRLGADLSELAMADSSDIALVKARGSLPRQIDLYQADLMNLGWRDRWDLAFLLDVIEHCPDDREIFRQALKALRPGGKLFVTTPALQIFWSYNDEVAHHLRRYSVDQYRQLAEATGFRLVDARYFMFFLSPLYFVSRKVAWRNSGAEDKRQLFEREHRTPHPYVNGVLRKIFEAETGIGHAVRFPWGTSVLGIFEKMPS
jgi:SAM-dependent methyltransferase